MLNSLRKMLVKPRFGIRRCSGIWPPSKPRIMRDPVRERCPLCPRVDVLPMPEPMPRPTRLRFSDAFFGARMLDKFMISIPAATCLLQSLCRRDVASYVSTGGFRPDAELSPPCRELPHYQGARSPGSGG